MAGKKAAEFKKHQDPVDEDNIHMSEGSDEVDELAVALRKLTKFVTTKSMKVKQVERLIEVAGAADCGFRNEVSLSFATFSKVRRILFKNNECFYAFK